MKWDAIPKFKGFETTKCINFGFVLYMDFVNKQVKKYGLQLNPDFHRGHVWTKNQQEKYIEFILCGGQSGRDFYFNKSANISKYVCLDGLQRTTAFERFVNGEIMAFGQYYDEFGFTKNIAGYNPLPEFKVNVFINNFENEGEILEWYIGMNAGGTPHTNDEIGRVKKMLHELG